MKQKASITVLEDLVGIRERRSMYGGSTSVLIDGQAPSGLTHLAQEIVSNAVDEHILGRGNEIHITIDTDQTMTIQDFGKGLPKGPGASFRDVINATTKPHASDKFYSKDKTTLGLAGMNGIGLKLANATSTQMTVHGICRTEKETTKDGENKYTGGLEEYYIKLNMSNVVEKKIINTWKKSDIKEDVLDMTQNTFTTKSGETIKTGTTISFTPDGGPVSDVNDQPVYESIVWTNPELYRRFEGATFLNSGLTVHFTDNRKKNEDGVPLQKQWHYPGGITEYLEKVIASQPEPMIQGMKAPIVFNETITGTDGRTYALNAALAFVEDSETNIQSYANGVPTKDGGPHHSGFESAVVKTINQYTKDRGLDKKLKLTKPFTKSDVLEGLIAVIEIRLESSIAEFTGQTKEKLSSTTAQRPTMTMTEDALMSWLHDHATVGDKIVGKINDAKRARESSERARRESKKVRQLGNGGLTKSSKLKTASSRKPEEKELYITEGDSASNIQRDLKTQAIFPIRGKILNVYNEKQERALKNVEISTLAAVLGAGVGKHFDLKDLQYHKVILACDSDEDGGHIASLLITLFYRMFRPLVEAGHLYIVESPLYKAVKYKNGKREVRMFYSEHEMRNYKGSLEGYDIQRYKGLGEMNKDEAYDAVTNKETQRLVQVTVDSIEDATSALNQMMGNKAELRREWYHENNHLSDDELALSTATSDVAPKKIRKMKLSQAVYNSMGLYTKATILRAIPDARDGLKPVHRRIMWQTHVSNLTPKAKHIKVAKLTGLVMAYHPHGDSSINDAIVTLARDWMQTLPLIDIQGNKGGVDGSKASAARYIEARQSVYAPLLFENVKKNAVDFVDNYDHTEREPTVLPAKFPLAIINGASGVASGFRSEIYPHNPLEIMKAAKAIAQDRVKTSKGLEKIILGPDFPTGGILINNGEIAREIHTGEARFTVRGKVSLHERAKEPYLDITEIPFSVNSEQLIESIQLTLGEATGLPVADIRNDTVRDDISIKVICKRGSKKADLQKIEHYLYQKSKLEVNITAKNQLVHNKDPKVMNMYDYLKHFVDFRMMTLKRIWQYELDALIRRKEVLDGLLRLFDITDEVIAIAKQSTSKSDFIERLKKKYKFTHVQSEAIAMIPIHRLGTQDLSALKQESKDNDTERQVLSERLNDEKVANAALVKDLSDTERELKDCKRQTQIVDSESIEEVTVEVAETDIIEKKDVKVVVKRDLRLSQIGAIAYSNQIEKYTEDDIVEVLDAQTTDYVMAITPDAKVVTRLVADLVNIPLKSQADELYKSIPDLKSSDVFIGAITTRPGDTKSDKKLLLVTEYGYVKVIPAAQLLPGVKTRTYEKKVGKASSLKQAGDSIRFVKVVDDEFLRTHELRVKYDDPTTKQGESNKRYDTARWLKRRDTANSSGVRSLNTKNGQLKIKDYSFEKIKD